MEGLNFLNIKIASKENSKEQGVSVYFSKKNNFSKNLNSFKENLNLDWQGSSLSQEDSCVLLSGKEGPLFFVNLSDKKTSYEEARESVRKWGMLSGLPCSYKNNLKLHLYFLDTCLDTEKGVLVGLQNYFYKHFHNQQTKSYEFVFHSHFKQEELSSFLTLSQSISVCRHFVNLTAGELNPKTYPEKVQEIFKESKTSKVEVFDHKQLEKMNMNLLTAVGRGAEFPSCLVRISYRPNSNSNSQPPKVFIGKGITFDTGGLDVKPSVGMRKMKKDMGGSASVLGLAYWAENSQYSQACDFYLVIAENSVSSLSFRPGDVIRSRAGLLVEIDNTDAEGRLVLADALSLACDTKPEWIVDVATLTGAMRVALGKKRGGFFSNNEKLKNQFKKAYQEMAEEFWEMPLDESLEEKLYSSVADCVNSADAFGGATTAALFLKKFVNQEIPWIHLDIYAWNDGPQGSFSEAGGNGQSVATLAGLLMQSH